MIKSDYNSVKREIPKQIVKGDIFYCSLPQNVKGSVQKGIKPVVVLSNDKGNMYSTTLLVACITSKIKKEYLPTHVVINGKYGLSRQSMILLEQVYTLDKSQLKFYLGRIDDKNDLRRIDNAIAVSFGLSQRKYSANRFANIESLCPEHRERLMREGKYIIKKCDGFQNDSIPCDVCGKNYASWYYVSLKDCFKKEVT